MIEKCQVKNHQRKKVMSENRESEEEERRMEAWQARLIGKSRFTPVVAEMLVYKLHRGIAPRTLPSHPDDALERQTWEMGLGKKIDPDLYQWIVADLKDEARKKRVTELYDAGKIREHEMEFEMMLLQRRPLEELCGIALRSGDSAFFRAVADIVELINDNGVMEFQAADIPMTSEEGEWVEAYRKALYACYPRNKRCPEIEKLRIEWDYREPSIREIWLVGDALFHWTTEKFKTSNAAKSAEGRMRKFLDSRGIPYRKK